MLDLGVAPTTAVVFLISDTRWWTAHKRAAIQGAVGFVWLTTNTIVQTDLAVLTVTKRSLNSSILRLSCSSVRVERSLREKPSAGDACKEPLPATAAAAGAGVLAAHEMARVWCFIATAAQRRTEREQERNILKGRSRHATSLLGAAVAW